MVFHCALNLSPDKPRVWRQIARMFHPGGGVAVRYIVLLKPLPDAVREIIAVLLGCFASAALLDEPLAWMCAAGLADIGIRVKSDDLAAMESDTEPLYRRLAEVLPFGARLRPRRQDRVHRPAPQIARGLLLRGRSKAGEPRWTLRQWIHRKFAVANPLAEALSRLLLALGADFELERVREHRRLGAGRVAEPRLRLHLGARRERRAQRARRARDVAVPVDRERAVALSDRAAGELRGSALGR